MGGWFAPSVQRPGDIRGILGAVLFPLGALLLSSCAGSMIQIDVREFDSTVIFVASMKESWGTPQARFDGQLLRGAEGCIFGVQADASVGVAFPEGTEIDAAGIIELPGGGFVTLGDVVGLSGGYYPKADVNLSTEVICPAFSEYFIISGDTG